MDAWAATDGAPVVKSLAIAARVRAIRKAAHGESVESESVSSPSWLVDPCQSLLREDEEGKERRKASRGALGFIEKAQTLVFHHLGMSAVVSTS